MSLKVISAKERTKDATADDIRFTAKGDTLYAIALGWPDDGILRIKSLGVNSALSKGNISNIKLLGSKAKIKWNNNLESLEVHLPSQKPCDHAFVLVLTRDL